MSPVEVTRASLDRIEALDGFSSTFLEVLGGSAATQAQIAESEIKRGLYRGALHGIPVALKDLCDVEGTVTTAGSKVLGERPSDTDCELARRLRAAGAIIIGKTNLHEFAYGGTGVNPHFGTPPNPWGLDRIPGGSSSGSAVSVATGMAPAAIGSDTGGSIRLPASHCGITGLKPTFGRVSRRGVFPLSMTLDNVGPMTRSALDCALVLEAIAGYDPGDPYSVDRQVEKFSAGIDIGIRGRRIGVPSNFFFEELEVGVEESVKQALDVLRDLGAVLVDVEIPWALDAFQNNIVGIEAAWVHRERLADSEVSARIGKDTVSRLR
ncbi:MAG: amidase, partial [Gammaproteobacteria bacterium]|nr:amidase [Gammaproteobacteria bacterium]